MAYDWPDGWNETRTEKAIQEWVCDQLDMPKYAVRVSIDSDAGRSLPRVDVFKPLTTRPTSAVHEVFGRLSAFAPDDKPLIFGRPKEKVGEHTYTLHKLFIHSPADAQTTETPP